VDVEGVGCGSCVVYSLCSKDCVTFNEVVGFGELPTDSSVLVELVEVDSPDSLLSVSGLLLRVGRTKKVIKIFGAVQISGQYEFNL